MNTQLVGDFRISDKYSNCEADSSFRQTSVELRMTHSVLYKLILQFLFIAIIFPFPLPAQTAESYFPTQKGTTWVFSQTILDTIQKPVDSLRTNQREIYVRDTIVGNRSAKLMISRQESGGINSIWDTTYIALSADTSFVRFGSYEFLDLLFSVVPFPPEINIDTWFTQFIFNPQMPIPVPWTIFEMADTVEIDSIPMKIGVRILGFQGGGRSVTVPFGRYDNCKFFLITSAIGVYVNILGNEIFQPLVSLKDSVWVAPSNWIVKTHRASEKIDFSLYGLGTYWIPGAISELIEQTITSVKAEHERILPENFLTISAYPNPFNSTTAISYVLLANSHIQLKVFNILGREAATLVNESQPAGLYKINWNASSMPSGVYFIRLQVGNKTRIGKLILLR